MANSIRICLLSTCLFIASLLSACGPLDDPSLSPAFHANNAAPIPEKVSSQYNEDRNLYWGDLHIHTGYSTDAYTMGVRATPDDAYTFTRGGEIEHAAGYGIQLRRPLDFAAVTDHSEYLGLIKATNPDLPLSARSIKERLQNDSALSNTLAMLRTTFTFDLKNVDSTGWEQHASAAWQAIIDAAQRHNIPGEFTTFVAYEWSSMPEGRNLHRNVIYRSTQVPDLPFSSLTTSDPRDLWTALEQQREQGMDNFAIPHNGNVSDGRMYDRVMYDGEAMDAEYAERRTRNEPVSEIFQVKGSSETYPTLSPDDAFAGFELYDTKLSRDSADSQPAGSYIRDALRTGIEMSHGEGFNPYRFGVIGSSDGHNASAPFEEDNYHGKLPILDGSAGIRLRKSILLPDEMPGGKRWSAAGLAAVWAEENTREALFDAMRRKETFATSGPRISVRFYAGWEYDSAMIEQPDWIKAARAGGVPMGGALQADSVEATSPGFLVFAQRDPDSGNLDRVQIVKGWVNADGKSEEKVFDVVWAGERKPDANGELPPVGNTVDIAEASYSNSIGAAQLATLWYDPEFNAEQEAFYYARVIEIPTPRWTSYDAKQLGIEAPSPGWLQERAVTSAIWYQPAP